MQIPSLYPPQRYVSSPFEVDCDIQAPWIFRLTITKYIHIYTRPHAYTHTHTYIYTRIHTQTLYLILYMVFFSKHIKRHVTVRVSTSSNTCWSNKRFVNSLIYKLKNSYSYTHIHNPTRTCTTIHTRITYTISCVF